LDKPSTSRLVEQTRGRFGVYEGAIFAFLLLEFFFLVGNNVSDTNTRTAYLLSYEFGFGPQAFAGSILYLFTDIVTSRMIFIVSVISFLLMAAQISLLLGYLIRKSGHTARQSTAAIALLFLASPLSVTYLLGMHMQRLDVYWIILTLLALSILRKPVLRWTVPLLCAAALCIHQGFMSTYMPALAIPMLYEVYQNPRRFRNYLLFGINCLVMILLFAYFQFAPSHFPFGSAAELAAHLSQRADFAASAPMLHVGFFAPAKEWLFEYTLPFTASYALPLGMFYLVSSVPLIAVFVYIWYRALRRSTSKFLRLIFVMCAAAPLVFIPAALAANDWDRYWAAAVNGQFILIFYFIYAREKTVTSAAEKVGGFFEEHPLILPAVLIVMNALTFSAAATDIFSFIKDKEATAELIENYFNRYVYHIAGG